MSQALLKKEVAVARGCVPGLTSQPSVDAAAGIELDEYSYTDTDVTQILR